MIIRLARAGTSFKGVVTYLTHDVKHAKTNERIAWTHGINLAFDSPLSAVDEMFTTARNAEALKAEAGVRSTGKSEKCVKHVSLNWHPSERPDKEAMIAAAQEWLTHMGWQGHQAFIVCHTDKQHPHIHLVINTVHPETGRRLDDSFEKRRMQAWALGYEQSLGKVFCEQRALPFEEREPSAPRPVWALLEWAREAHDRAETERLAKMPEAERSQKEAMSLEWRALRELQRDERLAYFADGKAAFKALRSQIYRDVRKEFAPEWKAVFAAQRAGIDPATIAAMKAELIEQQRLALEPKRDAACEILREARDTAYRQLLDNQKEARAELQAQQKQHAPGVRLLERMAATAQARTAANENQPSVEQGADRHDAPMHPTAIQPSLWAQKAGLPHQERSAMRFLDRMVRMGRSRPAPEKERDASLPRRVAERGGTSGQQQEPTEPGLGLGPD